jgi:hypothetical protein
MLPHERNGRMAKLTIREASGRVPAGCGECFGPSRDLSAPCLSAGYPHTKPVFNLLSKPPDLHLNTLQLRNLKISNWPRVSDRLRLWPWRHSEPQDLLQAPHMSGQAGRHGWRPRPPPLGGAPAERWLRSP